MNTLQNLHTHTNYCDGKDLPEQMIEAAIEKGFGSIGFSTHSFTPSLKELTGKDDNTNEYKAHITRLKAEYADRLEIFLGLEYDTMSMCDLSGFDYLIGSVHSLKTEYGIASFDRSQDAVANIIDKYFGGNGMDFAKRYYEQLSQLTEYGKFDIVAHFDIITKHADNICFFDENSKEYMKYATDAMDALSGKIPFFEVNTGAIARGYRKTPYPNPALIKELKNRGFGAVITSDCHNRAYLDCYFDEAAELLKYCGFSEKYILTKDGWKGISL